MGNILYNIKKDIGLITGKLVLKALNMTNKSGTALPGNIALKIHKEILKDIRKSADTIILITGTNGKTTSNNLTNHILRDENIVLSNLKGANMIQGIVSSYIKDTKDHYDYGVFEVDEGSMPRVIKDLKPDYILVTNFFRDQLDRYGEIEEIVDEVRKSIKQVPTATLILNADDPYVNTYTKLENEVVKYSVKSDDLEGNNLCLKNCPLCGSKLEYKTYNYGNLGEYECAKCLFSNGKRDYIVQKHIKKENKQEITLKAYDNPINITFPYIGTYNTYNVCGVYALCDTLNIKPQIIEKQMANFHFSLGRMEDMTYNNKTIKIVLTKNPIGLSESIKLISNDKQKKSILQILNDNPADGQDTSWIWDGDMTIKNQDTILNYYCSGIRAEEMALRVKYTEVSEDKIIINDDFKNAIDTAIEDDVDILYVLPTYTAIFKTRDYIEKITKGD